MGTALDFKALLETEKRQAASRTKDCANQAPAEACKSPQNSPWAPCRAQNDSQQSLTGTDPLAWQAQPDRSIRLSSSSRDVFDLPQHAASLEAGPSGVFYISDFIRADEAADLLARIDEMPQECWINLGRRRLQNHGGTPQPEGMPPEPVPCFVSQLFEVLTQSGIFPQGRPPNHVLINSYQRGQGIAPHTDGPLYDSNVAIISLAGSAMLNFWLPRYDADGSPLPPHQSSKPALSVLAEPASLIVFSGEAYTSYWHGITATDSDVVGTHTANLHRLSTHRSMAHGDTVPRGDRRVSLTVRRVKHVRGEARPLSQD